MRSAPDGATPAVVNPEAGMRECLFCGIASGDVKANVVAQDGTFVAFRDINPQAPTHILLIPRRHVANLNDANDAGLLGQLLVEARNLARAEGLADRGYRVVINTNAEAGQSVFHLHAHLLGGRAMGWPPG
jgi:histidine triad (HIT) family protein